MPGIWTKIELQDQLAKVQANLDKLTIVSQGKGGPPFRDDWIADEIAKLDATLINETPCPVVGGLSPFDLAEAKKSRMQRDPDFFIRQAIHQNERAKAAIDKQLAEMA